ncbi:MULTISPECIES: ankyrin repeat domain-containing protein [Streptomyces]|uniref:ankyrin repeat domain-containing protein n=1 Tax=Streptomyces TaxID=1883 RepID=UPI002B272ADE|nr:ankyrin repeat domain-containing protein [Streptomyces scabiei]
MRACAWRSRLRSAGGGSGERDATSASTASNNSDIEAPPLPPYPETALSRTHCVRITYTQRAGGVRGDNVRSLNRDWRERDEVAREHATCSRGSGGSSERRLGRHGLGLVGCRRHRRRLDEGADPDSWNGSRPLHRAAVFGSPEAVAELARRVADVDALENGVTALWEAVMSRKPANAQALAAAGADPWRPSLGG